MKLSTHLYWFPALLGGQLMCFRAQGLNMADFKTQILSPAHAILQRAQDQQSHAGRPSESLLLRTGCVLVDLICSVTFWAK